MTVGWLKLHRAITEWEWYDDANTFRVFMHLLLTANRTDSKYRGHPVPKGAAVAGRMQLANDLGLSQQQVRTALEKLKSTNEITIASTSQFSIITIVKWAEYQGEKPTKQPSSNQRATNEQPHIQEGKKEEDLSNDKSIPAWLPKNDWDDFKAMRIKIRKPMTARAEQLIIGKLDEFRQRGSPPEKVLQRSVINDWQDVYELKEQKGDKPDRKSKIANETRELLERIGASGAC